MKTYAMEIAQFAGRRGRSCYEILDCAVEVAMRDMPRELPMAEICNETGRRCGRTGKAVYKALSRVTWDIWEYGNPGQLEKTIGYALYDRPSPKELVISLAQAFWDKKKRGNMEYHILAAGFPEQYGIWGCSAGWDGCSVVIAPFTGSRQKAEALAEHLNEKQFSPLEFKNLLLEGKLEKFFGK